MLAYVVIVTGSSKLKRTDVMSLPFLPGNSFKDPTVSVARAYDES